MANNLLSKETFYDKLKNIPKSETHLHVEAVLTKTFVSELLLKLDKKYEDISNVDKIFCYNSLPEFIDAFLLVQSAFKELSDFAHLMDSAGDYLKENGIVYTEMFFAPTAFLKKGWDFKQIMDIFSKKIDEIDKKYHIKIKLLIDLSRTFGHDNALSNFNLVLKNKNDNIIGVGLGGNEVKGPAKDFADIYALAKKEKLHRVAHAGEDSGPESIWDCIKYLNVERIGHGISSIQDSKLVRYLADKKIPLEICPTSNVFTKKYVKSIEEHPVRQLYDSGVEITIGTDDPSFFNVTLLDEFWNLYSKLNFSLDEIKNIIINSFKYCFLSENEKNSYIQSVESAWKKNFN